ncbi:hypothetical protein B0H17DRAFT_1191894 [Mycena rosella]|uniref:Uncharacterized protein n=1 Tax=Mycena rosella TaxID=1033263 RepID=A0AAD7M9Y0_MYCRO|nr:hypothetical protein B0H17DRAFT_1191894 [Mycena rosella]
MSIKPLSPGDARAKNSPNSALESSKTEMKGAGVATRGKSGAAGALVAHKSRKDLLANSDTPWATYTAEDAYRHLYAKGFILEEKVSAGMYMAQLAMVLYRIAAATTSVMSADACRAVGVVLEQRKVNGLIDHLADKVAGLRRATEEATARGPIDLDNGERMRTAAQVLTRTVEEQCGELETRTERLGESINELTGQVYGAKGDSMGALEEMTSATRSYAAVAAPPAAHAAAIAKAAARKHQILLENAPGMTGGFAELTEKLIVEKANMALQLMASAVEDIVPTAARFLGAVIQRSSAVLLHLDSAASAEWVRANKAAFLASFGGTTAFKDRFLNVLAQYVPLSFDPSQDGALHVLESDNNLPCGELGKTRWIKAPTQRRPGQKVGHLIIGFRCSRVFGPVVSSLVII